MALMPAIRGWATPNTLSGVLLGDRKFGAPPRLMSKSRARPKKIGQNLRFSDMSGLVCTIRIEVGL